MPNDPQGCNLLTKKQLFFILRDIVVNYGFRNFGGVNGFAVIDTIQDLYKEGFGKVFRDFTNNYFWGRLFAAAGSDPRKCASEYPALLIFCDDVEYNRTLRPTQECFTLVLLLLDKVDCSDCPNKDASIFDIDRRLHIAMNTILKELYSYKAYRRIEDDINIVDWLSDGKVEALKASGEFQTLGYVQCCDNIERNIHNSRERLRKPNWLSPTNNDKGALRGIMVEFDFCLCLEFDTDFNYNPTFDEPKAVTLCTDC
jgi:hypothetical protein